MNREQRRRFNKKNKTNFSAADFAALEVYSKMQTGEKVELEDLDKALASSMFHMDNEELVPEGTPVKLNIEAIQSRPQDELTQQFKDWVKDHQNQILHVTREKAQSSLVCVQEDKAFIKDNYTDEDHDIGHVPWLFDIYSDFLYEHPQTHEWVSLAQLPSEVNNVNP